MYCTQCGSELSDVNAVCSGCGKRLMLDKRNKKIGGVCAGFARYCGIDVTLMRILWLAVSLATGVGFLVYLGAWIILPSDARLEARNTITQTPLRM